MKAILLLGLLFVSAFAQHDNNRGTVKVHNGPDTDPARRNEPHVDCDFYIQGFGFNDPSGSLQFFVWRPTGDKTPVTPTGDSLTWTGTAAAKKGFDFQKGPYQLDAGHYRVEVYTDDGHPGNAAHSAKSKVFWVDECAKPAPPPVYPAPTPVYPAPTPAPVYEPAPAPVYEPAPAPEPVYEPAPAPEPVYEPAPAPAYPTPAPADDSDDKDNSDANDDADSKDGSDDADHADTNDGADDKDSNDDNDDSNNSYPAPAPAPAPAPYRPAPAYP